MWLLFSNLKFERTATCFTVTNHPRLSILLVSHKAKRQMHYKAMPVFYFYNLNTRPLFISFLRAALASSNVSTEWPSSNDILCMLNCNNQKIIFYNHEYKKHDSIRNSEGCQFKKLTCAPWRTRTSVPLLSMDMRAASSTSDSADKSSFRGFEKIALSS